MIDRWAVELLGNEFDLEDCKAALLPPFDPIVEIVELPCSNGTGNRVYLLKTRIFRNCTESIEVRELAIPIVRKLGALMAVYKNTGAIRAGVVVEMNAAGQYLRHNFGHVNITERDDRVSATASTDRHEIAVPRPSFAQMGLAVAKDDLEAALEHYSRADNWHDLFKSYEAIEHIVGDRKKVPSLGVCADDVDNFVKTAHIFRHHKTRKKPARTLSLPEGLRFVASLIRVCLTRARGD